MFKENRKKFIEQIKYSIYGFIPFVVLQGIFELTILDPSKKNVEVSIGTLSKVFDVGYWSSIWPSLNSYIRDNFTMWYFWFAVLGLIFVLIKYRSKFSKFLIGYVIAVPIYVGLLSAKIGGHSYYQMPFLPLFVILSAFFLFSIGTLLKQFTKIKYIEFAPLLLILLTLGAVQDSTNRVWDTNFYGQDVIGEYIQQRTLPNERIINLGHSQTQAVCTFAERRCGGFSTVEQLKEFEDKFNIRYMNIDAYSFARLQQDQESYSYIQNNYKIKLVGLLPSNGQLTIIDLVLERGGTFDISQIQNTQPVLAKTYTSKRGDIQFYTIEVP